jgi:hypothetical protein
VPFKLVIVRANIADLLPHVFCVLGRRVVVGVFLDAFQDLREGAEPSGRLGILVLSTAGLTERVGYVERILMETTMSPADQPKSGTGIVAAGPVSPTVQKLDAFWAGGVGKSGVMRVKVRHVVALYVWTAFTGKGRKGSAQKA